MKYPHNRYIVALILAKKDNKEIVVELMKHNLKCPVPSELNTIRRYLNMGHEAFFKDGRAYPDPNWLQELGIEAMYGYLTSHHVPVSIEGIPGAFNILEDSTMYKAITTLALAKIKNEELELLINSRYDLEYTSDEIDYFLHYFFSVRGWTQRDKEIYIETIDKRKLRFFYKMALTEDKNMVMWKLGISPKKEYDQMLSEMMADSFFNFKEHANNDPDTAQKWGNLALKVSEKLDKYKEERRLEQEDDEKGIQKFIAKLEITGNTEKKILNINDIRDDEEE